MRKLLLTLTAGIIILGAASTSARADWDDHGPVVVFGAPGYAAPYYQPPAYVPPVYAAPVYPQAVYGAPAENPYWQQQRWRQQEWRRHEGWERWHEGDDQGDR